MLNVKGIYLSVKQITYKSARFGGGEVTSKSSSDLREGDKKWNPQCDKCTLSPKWRQRPLCLYPEIVLTINGLLAFLFVTIIAAYWTVRYFIKDQGSKTHTDVRGKAIMYNKLNTIIPLDPEVFVRVLLYNAFHHGVWHHQ